MASDVEMLTAGITLGPLGNANYTNLVQPEVR
jgi:hypothetical protein